jgi:hypothetical protein
VLLEIWASRWLPVAGVRFGVDRLTRWQSLAQRDFGGRHRAVLIGLLAALSMLGVAVADDAKEQAAVAKQKPSFVFGPHDSKHGFAVDTHEREIDLVGRWLNGNYMAVVRQE